MNTLLFSELNFFPSSIASLMITFSGISWKYKNSTTPIRIISLSITEILEKSQFSSFFEIVISISFRFFSYNLKYDLKNQDYLYLYLFFQSQNFYFFQSQRFSYFIGISQKTIFNVLFIHFTKTH